MARQRGVSLAPGGARRALPLGRAKFSPSLWLSALLAPTGAAPCLKNSLEAAPFWVGRGLLVGVVAAAPRRS